MKHHIDEKEATKRLRQAGWTTSEIERLRGLRRDYVAQVGGQATASHRRSRLIRWLLALLQEGYGPLLPGGETAPEKRRKCA